MPSEPSSPSRDSQAETSETEAFDINLFMNRLQSLNLENPFHAAVAPLDSNSLYRYYQWGMTTSLAQLRCAAHLQTLSEDDFQKIEAVCCYIAHEISLTVDGACEEHAPAQHLPAGAPCASTAPAAGGEDQVLLCACKTEGAQPPG